jgi:hypothetical protein
MGVNEDSCVVIMLTLKTEENYAKMLEWLIKNKEANQDDVFNKLDEITERI